MRSTRVDWLIFLALGFMWGSSYLFIKIGVQDFGTFTPVALRLAVGAALLWTVLRVARTRLPRTPRVYGRLLLMPLRARARADGPCDVPGHVRRGPRRRDRPAARASLGRAPAAAGDPRDRLARSARVRPRVSGLLPPAGSPGRDAHRARGLRAS